jgi:transposase
MVQEHRGEYPSLWAPLNRLPQDRLCAADPADWVKRHEIDSGQRDGRDHATERERIKELEREVKELRRANEILKLASAFFAQAELDRRLKS